jgi:hypothetical protein
MRRWNGLRRVSRARIQRLEPLSSASPPDGAPPLLLTLALGVAAGGLAVGEAAGAVGVGEVLGVVVLTVGDGWAGPGPVRWPRRCPVLGWAEAPWPLGRSAPA